MNLRPNITDEQLRDLRDGLLRGAERRLVALQTELDEAVAARFWEIKKEAPALPLDAPSALFPQKIMRQLAAEGFVKQPVAVRRGDRVIRVSFAVLGVLFGGCLLYLLKDFSAASVEVSLPSFEIDWSGVVGSRAFLWSIYLACLLPAVMLILDQFNRSSEFVFVK